MAGRGVAAPADGVRAPDLPSHNFGTLERVDKSLNWPRFLCVTVGTVAIALVMRSYFGTDWWEFAGVVTGAIGVYLVAVEHIWNWPIGILNVLLYAYVFFGAKLYADMTLVAQEEDAAAVVLKKVCIQ